MPHAAILFVGGGYVLSKEALTRYATRGHHQPKICTEDGGAEDVQFGKCKYVHLDSSMKTFTTCNLLHTHCTLYTRSSAKIGS